MDLDVFFKQSRNFDFQKEFATIVDYYNGDDNNSFFKIVYQNYDTYPYKEGCLSLKAKIDRIFSNFKKDNLNGYLYLCQEILNVINYFKTKKYISYGDFYSLDTYESKYLNSLSEKIKYDLTLLGFESRKNDDGKINIYSINPRTHEILKTCYDQSIKDKIIDFNVLNASLEQKRIVIVDLADYFTANKLRERLKSGPEIYKRLESYLFRLATYFRKPEQTKDNPDKSFIQDDEEYWISKTYDLFLLALLHLEAINTLNEIDLKIDNKKGE